MTPEEEADYWRQQMLLAYDQGFQHGLKAGRRSGIQIMAGNSTTNLEILIKIRHNLSEYNPS